MESIAHNLVRKTIFGAWTDLKQSQIIIILVAGIEFTIELQNEWKTV